MSRNPPREGMSVVVQTVARWLKGFILLYGISIVLYGHITPGGGFAGGVVIASAFILLMLAQGERRGLSFFSKGTASTLDSVGVLAFLAARRRGHAVGRRRCSSKTSSRQRPRRGSPCSAVA